MPDRIKKINELFKQELSQLILAEAEIPQGALVTITEVKTSRDLSRAKVYVSVFPAQYAPKILKKLERIDFQSFLYPKLFIRQIPEFHFVIDETESQAAEIEELLDRIKNKG